MGKVGREGGRVARTYRISWEIHKSALFTIHKHMRHGLYEVLTRPHPLQIGDPVSSTGPERTRPDTRLIPVADGWAGAEMRVFPLSDSITTDRRTNGPTDGRTKPLIESLVRD